MYRFITLLFFIMLPLRLWPQVLPKEDSKLNYRIIGFSFPPEPKAVKYTLEIAAGNYNSEDSFKKNRIFTTGSKNHKLMAETPHFGAQYTWRVIYNSKNGILKKSGLHHFATLSSPHVDTTKLRMRI